MNHWGTSGSGELVQRISPSLFSLSPPSRASRLRRKIAALQLRLPAEEQTGITVADRVAGVQALAPLSFEQRFPTPPVPPCPHPLSPSPCHLPGQSTPSPPRCTSSPSPTSHSPRCEDGLPIARATACASPLNSISSTARSLCYARKSGSRTPAWRHWFRTDAPCAPQILRADLEMAGLLCVLVPQGTRTGENGRVLFPDAS